MEEITKIVLPEREYIEGLKAYGANKVAARYCGLNYIPFFIYGEWQHGWICPERNIHPEFVVGGNGFSREYKTKRKYFVARQDQVDYLVSQGYRYVYAIGLPIIYVQKPLVRRMPGSLLVMPAHSLPETTEDWDADEYANYIMSIANNFTEVYLCVHKYCYEKGNWIKQFADKNINVIVGADWLDQNSMWRIADLFSQFEYVTTNEFGSHVAYASYFNCKVSVAGPRSAWKKADYEKASLYRDVPELLDILDCWRRDAVLEGAYPQFVCEPWAAVQNVDWASEQLGECNKKEPLHLKHLFGWSPITRVKWALRSSFNKANIGSRSVIRSFSKWITNGYR
ncbi:MAG: hypothetical protein PHI97_27015 [Desulfobulbus sp.]|nr:hypothetical protein [Desulfobulbus sp.]